MRKPGFYDSQRGIPLNECQFVFESRTVTVAYQGTCKEALEQLYKSKRCTEEEISNIVEIKEKDLRKAA